MESVREKCFESRRERELVFASHHLDKEGWPTRPHDGEQERAGREKKRTNRKAARKPSIQRKRKAEAAAGTTNSFKHFAPLPRRAKEGSPRQGTRRAQKDNSVTDKSASRSGPRPPRKGRSGSARAKRRGQRSRKRWSRKTELMRQQMNTTKMSTKSRKKNHEDTQCEQFCHPTSTSTVMTTATTKKVPGLRARQKSTHEPTDTDNDLNRLPQSRGPRPHPR